MPKRPSSDTTPDLFLAASTTSAKSPSIRQGKAIPDNSAAQTRDALPGDLARALKRLNDTEVDTLLAAATREAQRRGRLPRASASKAPTVEDVGGSLTRAS